MRLCNQLISAVLLVLAMSLPAMAEIVTEEIAYDFEGTTHKGILAYDPAISSLRPGILVVHEWTGRNDYAIGRAKELAGMGYVAFAADYYGDGKSTTDRKIAGEWAGAARADLDRFQRLGQAALEVLKSQVQVDKEKLGAIGFCFGGTASLQLAYTGADLDGIVCFHGSPVPPREGEIENVKAAILILHGASDGNVASGDLDRCEAALEAADVEWETIMYGHAVHAFTNPEAGNDPSKGAAYQERAAKRSWEAMRIFFEEIFAR